MKYFISDTHFGHEKIIQFERTQFNSIREHDLFIIHNLQKLSKDDVLYHLGDFGFHLADEVRKEWDKIKAKKIIIMGNHDTKSIVSKYFDEVHSTPIFLMPRILLSHYPMPVTDGSINIHGHLHNYTINKENYLNVNIHQLGYKPLKEKHLTKMLQNISKDNWKFRQEWFKDLYEPY